MHTVISYLDYMEGRVGQCDFLYLLMFFGYMEIVSGLFVLSFQLF